MNWTIKTRSTACGIVSFPFFEAEKKKEKKAAQRMNGFYGDIISAIEKSSAENEYKCYIDISSENTDKGIIVSFTFRARQRGRTIKNISHHAIWKNGVIISQEKQ